MALVLLSRCSSEARSSGGGVGFATSGATLGAFGAGAAGAGALAGAFGLGSALAMLALGGGAAGGAAAEGAGATGVASLCVGAVGVGGIGGAAGVLGGATTGSAAAGGAAAWGGAAGAGGFTPPQLASRSNDRIPTRRAARIKCSPARNSTARPSRTDPRPFGRFIRLVLPARMTSCSLTKSCRSPGRSGRQSGSPDLLPESLGSMAILLLQVRLVYQIGNAYGYPTRPGTYQGIRREAGRGLTPHVQGLYVAK